MPLTSDRHILQVQRVRRLSPVVREYELSSPDGAVLPSYEAGAHIDLQVPTIGVRQYSLVRMWRPGAPYTIAVQREPHGRGGSSWIHDELDVGAFVEASAPRNHFALVEAPKTLLIAGGIGLTPILCMAETCEVRHRPHQVVICARDEERLFYSSEMLAPRNYGDIQFVLDGGDPTRGVDIVSLLQSQPTGTHVYCCGPSSLMDAVRAAGQEYTGLTLHFEAFGGPASKPVTEDAGAFLVECRKSGQVVEINPGESILDRLMSAGIDVDHSCREGYCGTCTTRWLSGKPLHHDTCLSEEERDRYVAICTARGEAGSTLVLDL